MTYDELISRPDAVDRVGRLRHAIPPESTDSVSLDAIAGRTLATAIVAAEDSPRVSHATMDGFAFDATDAYPLTIVGEVFPEDDPQPLSSGEAIEIATGASLPEGANAVLKREEATVEDGQLFGTEIGVGTYTYERGSNVEAGEQLFSAGERLSPQDAILLRDLGYTTVTVHSRRSVGLLATGTEIHEGRSADLDSPMLAGLIRSWGHEPTHEGTVTDDYERVKDRIEEVATTHDVVVTTGGTSVGHKDHVVRALGALGDIDFHGVRIRPGKPIAVATLPDHDAIAFAIPGKPVGAFTIATAVVRPFFTGETRLPGLEATFARDVDLPREGFEYWIPVTLEDDPDMGDASQPPIAMPLGHVDSPLEVYDRAFDPSVLSSSTRATRADGVLITETGVSTGDRLTIHPYEAFT